MPQPSILILGVPLTDIAVFGEAFVMLEGAARRERYQLSSRTLNILDSSGRPEEATAEVWSFLGIVYRCILSDLYRVCWAIRDVRTTLLLADSTSEKISLYLRHVSAQRASRRKKQCMALPCLACSYAIISQVGIL